MTKVLVVDDSHVTRSLIKLTLETLDKVTVDTAESAKQALSLCKNTRYDIMIFDYLMPERTGLDLLEELNTLHLQDGVPVFILSSESNEQVKKRAQNQQVKAWLKKPFRPQTLLELIKNPIHHNN